MDESYWRSRWAQGQTGWHEAAPNRFLVKHLAVLDARPNRRVLVPLAGKSPDLTFLAQEGADVIGAELVEDAVRAYFAERGLRPEEQGAAGHLRLTAGTTTIWVGDFFALRPEAVGRIDAVYDRAALVALPPPLRERYAAQLRALAPGAPMLTVTFAHDAPADGPPFSVTRPELDRLFGAAHVTSLDEGDVFDPRAGLAARGATYARELVHRVQL